MGCRFQILLTVCAATCVSAFAPLAVATSKHMQYELTIIAGTGTEGRSIGNDGVVAGKLTLAGGMRHAATWAFGQQTDLGTLGTGKELNSIVLWPVKNYVGVISGISLTDELDPNKEIWSCGYFIANPNFNVCRGFVWEPSTGKMRALPTLGGTHGFATATNTNSETVGWAENTVRDPTCNAPQVLQFKPVVWGPEHEEVRALPLIDGDESGAATAINDRGQIVGISGDCGDAVGSVSARHAVIWDNGTVTELVNPNGAPYWNTPMMINRRGDVVGFAGVPADPSGELTPPFMWTKRGGWKFLSMLSGEIGGAATSINSHRHVVGYSYDANGNFHPWIWRRGKTTNLNCVIKGYTCETGPILLALDINDRGQITGRTAAGEAFVLTPIRGRDDDDEHDDD